MGSLSSVDFLIDIVLFEPNDYIFIKNILKFKCIQHTPKSWYGSEWINDSIVLFAA